MTCTIEGHEKLPACHEPQGTGPTVAWPDRSLAHARCSICGGCYDCAEFIAWARGRLVKPGKVPM